MMRSRDIDGDVFDIRMRKHQRAIYAKEVRQLKKAKRLYRWKKNVTYDDLTIEEIEKSINRADRKNRRKKGRKAKQEEIITKEKNNLSNETGDSGSEWESGSEWDQKLWERIGSVDLRTLGN